MPATNSSSSRWAQPGAVLCRSSGNWKMHDSSDQYATERESSSPPLSATIACSKTLATRYNERRDQERRHEAEPRPSRPPIRPEGPRRHPELTRSRGIPRPVRFDDRPGSGRVPAQRRRVGRRADRADRRERGREIQRHIARARTGCAQRGPNPRSRPSARRTVLLPQIGSPTRSSNSLDDTRSMCRPSRSPARDGVSRRGADARAISGSVSAWLKGELAKEVGRQTETETLISLWEKTEVIALILERIHGDLLQPVIVFDDSDRWLATTDSETVSVFFHEVVRWLTDLPAAVVVATHSRYLELGAARTDPPEVDLLEFLDMRIVIPRVPSAATLARILERRIARNIEDTSHAHATLSDAVTEQAVEALFGLLLPGRVAAKIAPNGPHRPFRGRERRRRGHPCRSHRCRPAGVSRTTPGFEPQPPTFRFGWSGRWLEVLVPGSEF